jgi:hypothetical protein
LSISSVDFNVFRSSTPVIFLYDIHLHFFLVNKDGILLSLYPVSISKPIRISWLAAVITLMLIVTTITLTTMTMMMTTMTAMCGHATGEVAQPESLKLSSTIIISKVELNSPLCNMQDDCFRKWSLMPGFVLNPIASIFSG